MAENVINEVDKLKFLLANTEARRLQAEVEKARLTVGILENALQRAQAELRAVSETLRSKYELAEGDQVDPQTGEITRAQGAAEAADEPASE